MERQNYAQEAMNMTPEQLETWAIGPQCIIGTQISDILDVTRTRLPEHAARGR